MLNRSPLFYAIMMTVGAFVITVSILANVLLATFVFAITALVGGMLFGWGAAMLYWERKQYEIKKGEIAKWERMMREYDQWKDKER